MSDLNLKPYDPLYPMRVHPYEELLKDQNASVIDKINSIIVYLNTVGKLTNDVVKNWNTVYNWVMNEGLTTGINNKLEDMLAKGEFNPIFNDILIKIGDITTLTTTDKTNLTKAINELVSKIGNLANLTTTDKTSLVNAINENTSKLAEKATFNNAKLDTIYAKALKSIEVIPKNSLKQAKKAIASGTINVVVWGDSITQGANQVLSSNAWANRFQTALINALPGVTINFRNYSYGGKTSADAVSDTLQDLSSIMPFYDITKTWKDNVKSFNPDLIIFAFGMNDTVLGNDADYFHANNISTLNTYINTWAIIPSLVLVPTMQPLVNGTYGAIDDRLRIQRATRNFAKTYGFACMDAGRLWNILQRGFDDESRFATFEDIGSNYPTKWTGDLASYVKSGSSLLGDNLTGKSITNNEPFYNGEIKVVFFNRDTNATFVKYRVSPTGYMMVKVKTGASGSVTLYTNTDQLATQAISLDAGSTFTLTINAKDSTHTISINNVVQLTETNIRQMRDGYITIGSDGLTPNIGTSSITFDNTVTGDICYTDNDLLGTGDPTQSGNHNNHPTGLGYALAYVPAFDLIIKELAKTNYNEVFNFKGKRYAGNTIGKTPLTPALSDAGETMYFFQLNNTKYDTTKGVYIQRVDTGKIYTLSTLAISYGTLHLLESGRICYYHDAGGSDYITISDPGTGASLPFDFCLFMYQ